MRKRRITRAEIDAAKAAADTARRGSKFFKRRDLQRLVVDALRQDVRDMTRAARAGKGA